MTEIKLKKYLEKLLQAEKERVDAKFAAYDKALEVADLVNKLSALNDKINIRSGASKWSDWLVGIIFLSILGLIVYFIKK